MNEIINAIPEYVITAVISTAIFMPSNTGKPLSITRRSMRRQLNHGSYGAFSNR